MSSFFKQLFLLYFLFLTTGLFADNIIQKDISISNATAVQESDSYISFTVNIESQPSSLFGDLIVHYQTINNGSAVAGSDYTSTEGDLTFTSDGSTSQTITIPILDDSIHESDKTVSVKITTTNLFYEIIDGQGDGIIHDDDADTTISIDVDCNDGVDEGDISDTNSISCTITLNRVLTTSDADITINYQTQDASSYVATPNVDYTALNSSVIFTTGESIKLINIPIIGDTELEHDELLKLVISGSPFIHTSSSEVEIWDDDGSFPHLSFENTTISVMEGNSSQKILELNITLDAPALAGSHFSYGTWGESAEDQWGDNDYIETTNDINFTGNERYFTIQIPIVGDTKIESDELFHVGFWDLDGLDWGAIDEVAITILNDDGSYPTLQFNQNSYSITEGNSSTQTIDFNLSLDSPAIAGSHFDYYTQDGISSNKALVSDNDYMEVNRTTYTFAGGERNISISITIKGDINPEEDEEFYLKIDNESSNLIISVAQSSKGIILNDDGSYPPIQFTQPSYSIIEGNSGQKELNVTLTLDAPALANTHIDYYTLDNTAQDGSSPTEDSDYVTTSGTLNIEENTTTASLIVKINGDTNIEADDSFYLYIKNPKNLKITSNSTEIIITNDDNHSKEAFTCDEHMYLSSSVKRGSIITGKIWLHRIETTQSPFGFEVMDDEGEDKLYNALAYSEKDNYIYGLYYKELFKISKTGKVISLGDVTQLPDELNSTQAFAGASYNGYYFVTGFGIAYDKIFKIKLSDSDANRTVTNINLSIAVSIKDFSFSPDGKYLYGIADGGKLTKIDVTSGNVTFVGDAHTGYEFDSSFSDKNGRFFANDSNGGGFFEFNLNDGTKRFLSDSQSADYNDGANCINAELVFTDYGDAPISYGPVWHNIANGVYLGDNVDHDLNPYDTVDADGDDINGVDDDDGVTLSDGSDINGIYFDTNATHTIKVKLSKDAYLKVWIDKNIDGDFTDGSDLIYNSGTKLSAGEHNISFYLPANLTTNTKTYLRARVSSNSSMNPIGFVTDGEVEDYMVKFGSAFQPLRGKFNIERTNSGSYPNMSDARNAWYTQIVGRDFDYSLVFYKEDFSAEQNLTNITVRVDLMDMDTNRSLYQYNYYFPENHVGSRKSFTLPHDLDGLPATKNARFKVTYAVDTERSVVQANCAITPVLCTNHRSDKAKDNFAIRPDYYYMTILDNNNPIRVNTHDNNTSLRVSAGYDYNLSVVAHDNNGLRARDYNTSNITRVLEFLDKSNSACPIKDDYNGTDNFINGNNTNTLLKVREVGNYRLSMIDDIWTQVDSIKDDCDINSSSNSANGNIKVGCNIVSPDINLSSYPDHFEINLIMQNLPNSTHDDFIYMSEMNTTANNIAISYQGNVTAKNEDNETTQNFTTGYFAQNIKLDLNSTTLSDSGINKALRTSDGATAVNFARTIEFNSDGNINIELNPRLNNLPIINIDANKFTNEHNGTANIDIRYNIDKNINKTINPIQITFHSFKADSTNSNSVSHGKENPPYIPNGDLNLGDTIRNFYFAKVTPDRFNYPRINMNVSPIVRTPLSVDIFCDVNSSYCTQTGVLNNTKLSGTTREQIGWYISTNHNGEIDGNVTQLIANPTGGIVTLTPNPTLLTPLSLPHGHNGIESAKFNNCNNQQVEVTIVTDPVLAYQPNSYILNCTNNNSSQWIGVGNTGNTLQIKPKGNRSEKMNW